MTSLESLASTLTIGDLAAKSSRTVEQIVAYAMPAAKRAMSDQQVTPRDVDTQSTTARKVYYQRVLRALRRRRAWALAAELRGDVGGSPLQMRTALGRLIRDGLILHRGRARGTRYRIPENG